MQMALLVHIVAGGLGLASGVVALCAAKGTDLHRKSGVLFCCSMITLALLGALMAASKGMEATVIGGLLTAYLVITGLTTVRPVAIGSRWLALGGMLLALTIGLASVTLGFEAIASGAGKRGGRPAALFLMYGAVALVASVSDIRMMRTGGLQGASRLARHLWRMCFALFIATGSFFLGAARVFPKPLRIPGLLALPAAGVLLVMLYWLWRVGARPGQPGATARQVARLDLDEQTTPRSCFRTL